MFKEEQEDIYDLLFKYRGAFSLRDEIGTCPNIEVDLIVIDNSSSVIRPFSVKEEDKTMIVKEVKRLAHLGILKMACIHILHPLCSLPKKKKTIEKNHY